MDISHFIFFHKISTLAFVVCNIVRYIMETSNKYEPDIVYMLPWVFICLRDEFNFLNVHGIMNTSGLLQSKR